jgi:hypothetical protein
MLKIRSLYVVFLAANTTNLSKIKQDANNKDTVAYVLNCIFNKFLKLSVYFYWM